MFNYHITPYLLPWGRDGEELEELGGGGGEHRGQLQV